MRKPKVLYIEDTFDAAVVTKLLLEKHGIEVVISLSAEQGLQKADEVQPDLILLDIALPDMDGYEVCRQLRKKSATPIIFLTANNAVSEIQKGLLAGGNDYITKPYITKDLVERIHVRLQKEARWFEQLAGDQEHSVPQDETDDLGQQMVDVIAIMPSHDSVNSVYDNQLARVIHSLKLTTRRMDGVLSSNKVLHELRAMMYHAKLIIVDSTHSKPEVFYTLGLAHALGKEVILFSRSDSDVPEGLSDDQYLQYDDTLTGRHALESAFKAAVVRILNLETDVVGGTTS